MKTQTDSKISHIRSYKNVHSTQSDLYCLYINKNGIFTETGKQSYDLYRSQKTLTSQNNLGQTS